MTNNAPNIAWFLLAAALLAAAPVPLRSSTNRAPSAPPARRITCHNNLTQIGIALKTWSAANRGQFPWNVAASAGGTMEFRAPGPDGVDTNALLHFQVMSNELITPLLLLCPRDTSRTAAVNFTTLRPENLTYRLHTGTNTIKTTPRRVMVVCPIDGNTLYSDGTVTGKKEQPDDDSLGHPMHLPHNNHAP